MAQAAQRDKTTGKTASASKAAAVAPAATQAGWRQRMTKAVAPMASANLLQRVGKALAPRQQSASATAPKRSGMMRMMLGMLAFVVGSQVLFELIAGLDLHFQLGLERATIAPHNTPILGGLNGLLIIYIVIIGGLWYLLLRFNIIPKDPFGNAAARRAQTVRNQQTTTVRTGPARTRAERRHDTTTVAAKGASSAKGASTAKGASVSRMAADSGAHDDAYDRAAAERARRRRAARR